MGDRESTDTCHCKTIADLMLLMMMMIKRIYSVYLFLFLPSSGISPCVRTIDTVTHLAHVALGSALILCFYFIWGILEVLKRSLEYRNEV